MAKKSNKASGKRTGLSAFYHNNKNATHGLLAGSALFILLKGVIAMAGVALVLVSIVAILRKHLKKA